MSNQNPLKASVVVVTKDRPENLRNLLRSLIDQTLMPDEVIVVDNNSSKSYSSVLNEFRNRLNLTTVVETVVGIPAARNRGIKAASGDIILFTDDDCVADKHWVEEMVKPFYKNPYIGLVGGEINSEAKVGSLVEEFCISETLMNIGRQERNK
jgi:glycosyltransferase involved in cell wall biosynthesis